MNNFQFVKDVWSCFSDLENGKYNFKTQKVGQKRPCKLPPSQLYMRCIKISRVSHSRLCCSTSKSQQLTKRWTVWLHYYQINYYAAYRGLGRMKHRCRRWTLCECMLFELYESYLVPVHNSSVFSVFNFNFKRFADIQ